MKINYTSSVTGKRTTAHVDENIWSILQKTITMTGGKRAENDGRTSVEHWVTAFDKEFRTWAKGEAPTFSAYISKRMTEEVMMDLVALS